MPGNPVEVGTGTAEADGNEVSTSAGFAGTVGNKFLVYVSSDTSTDLLADVSLSHAGVSVWNGIIRATDFGTEFLMAFIGEVDAVTSDTLTATLTDSGIRKHVRVYEISDVALTPVDTGKTEPGVGSGNTTTTLDNAPSDSANLLMAAGYLSGNNNTIDSDDWTDFGELAATASTTQVSWKNGASDSDIVYSWGASGHRLSVIIELEADAGGGSSGTALPSSNNAAASAA